MFSDFTEKLASFSTKGKESVSLCRLSNHKKSIEVYFVHYKNNPNSKRLQFRKGSRILLEVFLSDTIKDLRDFSRALEDTQYGISCDKINLNTLDRIFLRILGRKIIYCSKPLCTTTSEMGGKNIAASIKKEVFVIKLCGWLNSSFVIFNKRTSTGSSAHKSSKRLGYNWVSLNENDCVLLKKSITDFLESNSNIAKEIIRDS